MLLIDSIVFLVMHHLISLFLSKTKIKEFYWDQQYEKLINIVLRTSFKKKGEK